MYKEKKKKMKVAELLPLKVDIIFERFSRAIKLITSQLISKKEVNMTLVSLTLYVQVVSYTVVCSRNIPLEQLWLLQTDNLILEVTK